VNLVADGNVERIIVPMAAASRAGGQRGARRHTGTLKDLSMDSAEQFAVVQRLLEWRHKVVRLYRVRLQGSGRGGKVQLAQGRSEWADDSD
jgi:hypothetical protein